MVRAVLAAGFVMMLAASTGCIQTDGLPAATADDESGARVPPGPGTRLLDACEGAPEPRDRAWACLSVASYVEQGIFGLQRDPARAARLRESAILVLEASCSRGDVTDCTRAAMVIGTVIGPADEAFGPAGEAARWMVEYADQGCRGGDGRGCALLGVIHEGGRGVPRDEALSADGYDRACARQHLPSCLLLASRAEGSARVAAYERACRAGSGHACATAVQHHARGVSVPSSVSRAGALFERGCTTLGNPAACVMGAELPEEPGAQRSRAVRLGWEACAMGIPDGCLLLGERLEREKRPHWAVDVYRRACELGDHRGCDAVRRVRGQARPRGAENIDFAEGIDGVDIGE